jgi:hypothetical protein
MTIDVYDVVHDVTFPIGNMDLSMSLNCLLVLLIIQFNS